MKIGYCNICGRKLTDPKSIARGTGPVCGGVSEGLGSVRCDEFLQKLEKIGSPIDHDIVLERSNKGEPVTNVPWTVIQGSPTGFAWGYGGSGPGDLALNILNAFVPPGHDGYPPVKCWRGYCSQTAWALHQDFKWVYLSCMDNKGGRITKETIKQMLAENSLGEPPKHVELI